MDGNEIVNWVILLLAAAAFGYMLYRGSTIKSAASSASEIKAVAEMAAFAAEEFARTGQITSSDGKLRYAIKVFRRWVPTGKLSDQDMIDAIHAAVPLVNSLRPGTILIEQTEEHDSVPPMPPVEISKPTVSSTWVDPQTGERRQL